MKCPMDGSELVIADRNGIEIDYCPKCRGVWLDRGELDKIIERTLDYYAPPAPPQDQPYPPPGYNAPPPGYNAPPPGYGAGPGYGGPPPGYDPRYDERRHHDDDYRGKPYKKKRRESFLDDLFDFG